MKAGGNWSNRPATHGSPKKQDTKRRVLSSTGTETGTSFVCGSDCPMQNEIPASFVWTVQDYVAFTRAVEMLRHEGHDSWIMRACLVFFGHFFLLSGLILTAVAISGKEGKNGPIPPLVVVIFIAISLIAAYTLITKWYGLRWIMNRAFRASQLPGLKVSYLFWPTEIESSSRLVQSKRSWNVVSQIVEFSDAFILISNGSAEWLPKYAFIEPFDDLRFLELARTLVTNHRFIDRVTFPNWQPVRDDSPRQCDESTNNPT